MRKPDQVSRTLIQHFFRRFFDNDTIQVDGDTTTTVVRALAIVAVPGLMVAFWLQNAYPQRSFWTRISDHYFFVLISFVVMGLVATFEWEMLFPDRLDFLVLSHLPVPPLRMFAAKISALAIFMALFLLAVNIFGALLLPMVSHEAPLRHLLAHLSAVIMSGLFAALLVITTGGVMLCVLSSKIFRRISLIVQSALVASMVFAFLLSLPLSGLMRSWLEKPGTGAKVTCPVWFLAIYEQILRGSASPPFAGELCVYALRFFAAAFCVAAITYPIAWKKVHRMAIEGTSDRHKPPARWIVWCLERYLTTPVQRAVFSFISQTLPQQ